MKRKLNLENYVQKKITHKQKKDVEALIKKAKKDKLNFGLQTKSQSTHARTWPLEEH